MIDPNDAVTQQLPTLELTDDLSDDLIELYHRLIKLQKHRVRIQAEIDNVRELIRQKGL